MSTLHCPLCGLRFRFASELDGHARDEHARCGEVHHPPPRRSVEDRPEARERVLPWPR